MRRAHCQDCLMWGTPFPYSKEPNVTCGNCGSANVEVYTRELDGAPGYALGIDDRFWRALKTELERARSHGPYASAHEGWAVLYEEVDELWQEVMKKSHLRNPAAFRSEALQIAAVALKFAECFGKFEHQLTNIRFDPKPPRDPREGQSDR